jgi:hypothetical protein
VRSPRTGRWDASRSPYPHTRRDPQGALSGRKPSGGLIQEVHMTQNKLKRDAHLDNEDQLPGDPGFRTRRGRSGYDPLDSNREAAFMEGTFFRRLFTFRLRTRNVFHLILMFIFGVIPFVPLVSVLIIQVSNGLKNGNLFGWSTPIGPFLILLFTAIAGALTVNFLLSVLEMTKR